MPNEIEGFDEETVSQGLNKLLTLQGKPEANIGLILSDSGDNPSAIPGGLLPNIHWCEVAPADALAFLRENIQQVALVVYSGNDDLSAKEAYRIRRGGAEVSKDPRELPVIPDNGLLETFGLPTVRLDADASAGNFVSAFKDRLRFVATTAPDAGKNPIMREFFEGFTANINRMKTLLGNLTALSATLKDTIEASGDSDLASLVVGALEDSLGALEYLESVVKYFKEGWPNVMAAEMPHYFNTPLLVIKTNIGWLEEQMSKLLGRKAPVFTLTERVVDEMTSKIRLVASMYSFNL